DLGATSFAGNVLRYNADGSFDEVFTQPTSTLMLQFPSDALFDPQGHLLTANLGPAHPPNLQGSIDQFASDGTFIQTLVSSSLFPTPGPKQPGIPTSQLVLFANQAPSILMPPRPVGYTENAPPVIFDNTATATDPDSPNLATGTLTVTITANGTVDDR